MKLNLSFQLNPPLPYHTFSYHEKKANLWIHQNSKSGLIFDEVREALRDFLPISGDHEILFFDNGEILKKCLESNQASCETLNFNQAHSTLENNNIENIDNIHPDIEGIRKIYFLPYINISDGACLRKSFFDINRSQSDYKTHIDFSYSVPFFPVGFHVKESFSFSLSYGFGMDTLINVWVVNKAFFSALDLPRCEDFTLDTSNGSALIMMYVLKSILTDMRRRGFKTIYNETVYKSITLYKAFEEAVSFTPLVDSEQNRSMNIICAMSKVSIPDMETYFSTHGFLLDYYGNSGTNTIRIANYPVHSKEQVERLADLILSL